MRTELRCLSFALLATTFAAAATAAPDAIDTAPAIACVKAWVAAIRDKDVERANRQLSTEARTFDAYSHPDAVKIFWHQEIAGSEHSLDAMGFQGEWRAVVDRIDGQTVVFVYPILPGESSREAIWVIRENNQWRIARLFHGPPE
jgi:hypothetical protein